MDIRKLEELKKLKICLSDEDKEIIDEFLQVCNVVKDIEELDEYVDLLLGIAGELDEKDQAVIYDIIDDIQK